MSRPRRHLKTLPCSTPQHIFLATALRPKIKLNIFPLDFLIQFFAYFLSIVLIHVSHSVISVPFLPIRDCRTVFSSLPLSLCSCPCISSTDLFFLRLFSSRLSLIKFSWRRRWWLLCLYTSLQSLIIFIYTFRRHIVDLDKTEPLTLSLSFFDAHTHIHFFFQVRLRCFCDLVWLFFTSNAHGCQL